MNHLLDTSAVLAHYLDEPGADAVEGLLARGPEETWLAAPSWAELDKRLADLVPDAREAERVFKHYTRTLCGLVPVDESAVLASIRLRRAAGQRLPLVDALIAGCATSRGLTLVHRDPHLDTLPVAELKVLRLAQK